MLAKKNRGATKIEMEEYSEECEAEFTEFMMVAQKSLPHLKEASLPSLEDPLPLVPHLLDHSQSGITSGYVWNAFYDLHLEHHCCYECDEYSYSTPYFLMVRVHS